MHRIGRSVFLARTIRHAHQKKARSARPSSANLQRRFDPILSQSLSDMVTSRPLTLVARITAHTTTHSPHHSHVSLGLSPSSALPPISRPLISFPSQSHREIASRSQKASTPCLNPPNCAAGSLRTSTQQGPFDPNFGCFCLTLRGIYLLQCTLRIKATL